MEIKRIPVYYGGKRMPWGKATIVRDAKGLIFLAGTEGRNPEISQEFDKSKRTPGTVVEGAEAQARMCFEKIKSGLEECGSSLDNILKIVYYIKGPEFPEGVHWSPTAQTTRRVADEFFREHCPNLCADKNPPPSDLIGVSGLGDKDMIVEIVVTAALP